MTSKIELVAGKVDELRSECAHGQFANYVKTRFLSLFLSLLVFQQVFFELYYYYLYAVFFLYFSFLIVSPRLNGEN